MSDEFSFLQVMAATSSEEAAVTWCRNVGLLQKELLCHQCGFKMLWYPQRKSYRCNRTDCRTERTYRKGSFFEKSRLPLRKIVLLMYLWCSGTPHHACQEMAEVSTHTLTDWLVLYMIMYNVICLRIISYVSYVA